MGKFGKAFKRAAKAFVSSMGPGEYEIGGKKVACPHCDCTEFSIGSAQLNTAGMTFAGLDWANKSVSTLACSNCGRIQWFLKSPERILNG